MTLNCGPKSECTLTSWFQNWHEKLGELSLEQTKVLLYTIALVIH